MPTTRSGRTYTCGTRTPLSDHLTASRTRSGRTYNKVVDRSNQVNTTPIHRSGRLHGTYNKTPSDPEKVFCNDLVVYAYNEMVRPYQEEDSNLALVLDDEHYQSTRSLEVFGRGLRVRLAQHYEGIYQKMKTNKPSIVEQLMRGDYGELNDYLEKESVVIDNADFCGSWTEKTKKIMRDRLTKETYAKRALVRLTLCARGLKMSYDEFVDVVKTEYIAMADGTQYSIKPLTIKQICPDYVEYGIPKDEGGATSYRYPAKKEYNPMIVTYWFLLNKI